MNRTPPHLILIGGGHAHVEVLRRFAVEEHPPLRLTLVSLATVHHYSGMVPGYLAGTYEERQLTFDLTEHARRAGGELVTGEVTAIDPTVRRLTLADGREIAYDLASVDVGSRAAGLDVPGVREHALTVKPLSRAVALRRRLDELVADGDGERRVVVVGGGAAGVEVAFAAETALSGVPHRVELIEAGDGILTSYDARFRRLADRALERRGIGVSTGTAVAEVEPSAVRLADGSRRAADLTLWLTGPAAPPLFAASPVPKDDRGYLLLDGTLRAVGHPTLFAAGDCATLRHAPRTPKAGVYPVRQAPILWQNLTAALAGPGSSAEPPAEYYPQEGFLSLLNTADGKALLAWKGMSFHSRWAWWLKDWIDRRFMRRYE